MVTCKQNLMWLKLNSLFSEERKSKLTWTWSEFKALWENAMLCKICHNVSEATIKSILLCYFSFPSFICLYSMGSESQPYPLLKISTKESYANN